MGKTSYLERFKEQRIAIRLCHSWGITCDKTRRLIKEVYGKDAMSKTGVHTWYSRFKAGRESTEDEPRSGRPVTVSTSEMTDKVRDLIKSSDYKPTIREIAAKLNISKGMCHRIVSDLLSDNSGKQPREESMASSSDHDHDEEKKITTSDISREELEALEMKLKRYLDANTRVSSNHDADVPDDPVTVRKEAMIASGSKQGFVRCGCKKCTNKTCSCKKNNLKCNSKCHNSASCANK